MASLDAYFTKRRQNVTQTLDKTKENSESKRLVVQAPQPIYDTKKASSEVKKKAPPKQTIKKNSILYYLSSPAVTQKEENQQEFCQIRMSLPLSEIWHDVLEEFDTPSPVAISPSHNTLIKTSLPLLESRKRLNLDDNDGTRNVRLRLHANPVTLCLEDYLQETDEDLSRPVRKRHSLETTQLYLLAVTREFSEDAWF